MTEATILGRLILVNIFEHNNELLIKGYIEAEHFNSKLERIMWNGQLETRRIPFTVTQAHVTCGKSVLIGTPRYNKEELIRAGKDVPEWGSLYPTVDGWMDIDTDDKRKLSFSVFDLVKRVTDPENPEDAIEWTVHTLYRGFTITKTGARGKVNLIEDNYSTEEDEAKPVTPEDKGYCPF